MRRGERSKRRRTRETCACRQGDSRRLRHGAAHGAVGLGSVPQGGSGGHYVRGLRRTHVKNGPAEYRSNSRRMVQKQQPASHSTLLILPL